MIAFASNSELLYTLYIEHSDLVVHNIQVGNYMSKDSNINTKTKCEICSKLTMKTNKPNGVVLLSLLLFWNVLHTLF